MRTVFLLGALILVSVSPGAAQWTGPRPSGEGVFALTDKGVIELTASGERQQVPGAIAKFFYSEETLDEIPVVTSIRAFYVNLMGWVPKDLFLVVGRGHLVDPRDDYRRLLGRAYERGPVAFEVMTENLAPNALERDYRSLTKKKKKADPDLRAFVVLELASRTGLNRRAYPLQVEIAPPPEK